MIELEKIHICDTDLDLNRRSTRFWCDYGRRIEEYWETKKGKGERKNEELELRDVLLHYYYRYKY
jgi:hypothetical protein